MDTSKKRKVKKEYVNRINRMIGEGRRMRHAGIALDTLGWLILSVIILIIIVLIIMHAQPLAERGLEQIRTILSLI